MLITSNPSALSLKAKLFRGLADPSRLGILEALGSGPHTVTDLVAITGLSQSNVSNHLGCLRDCGLVGSIPQGRFVCYELSDPRVARFLRLAAELLADVAQGVYDCTRYTLPDDAAR